MRALYEAELKMSEEDLRPCLRCPKEGPAVYVACLAAYNAGTLHGQWVDLSAVSELSFDEDGMAAVLQQCIDLILSESPEPGAEEWAIHDSQGLPKVLMGEWPELSELAAFTRQWELASEDSDDDAFKSWCDAIGEVRTYEDFQDAYMGSWDSEADFAEQFYADQGLELGPLASYIDWEQVWYGEFSCDGWWSEYAGNGVYWVFSS